MDNERVVYSPQAFGGGMGGGLFGGNGGILEGLLLGALFGNRRGGLFGGCEGGGGDLAADAIAAKVVELQETGDIKEMVGEIKGELKDAMNAEFRGVDSRLFNIAEETILARKDAEIAALKATNQIENRMTAFEVSTDKQFCGLRAEIGKSTQEILNKLAADKLDEKNDEISRLRAEKAHLTQVNLFSSQLQAIASEVQNMGTKITQFGAGNVATPVNTNQHG